ncbi:MAG: ParB N-terminal domain-containing protein [bacterium]|nr:ParB N-terminal domain-containing protein [bacterium]
MGRKNLLAGVDPFGKDGGEERPKEHNPLSMKDADAALFGDLAKLDTGRQTVRPIPINEIYPDIKQARRVVPTILREVWNSDPRTVTDMFNQWLDHIDAERTQAGAPRFELSDYLWSESVEKRARSEQDLENEAFRPGPMESAFLKIVELAVSIRRDGLTNPVTVEQIGARRYRLETGERRWLAFHMLLSFFNLDTGLPDERKRWERIPAIVVQELNVWRQASENTARADLNAIGKARQFAILMMDLLKTEGASFKNYEDLVPTGHCDRQYYAQVIDYRVPSGKGEMLANAMGALHRSVFTRCRTLLGLPDPVWDIADNLDISEDELLRMAKLPAHQAIEAAKQLEEIVATRNNLAATSTQENPSKKPKTPPTLPSDAALQRGKRLFSKQDEAVFKEILALRDGVGEAAPSTKQQLRTLLDQMQERIDHLKTLLENR